MATSTRRSETSAQRLDRVGETTVRLPDLLGKFGDGYGHYANPGPSPRFLDTSPAFGSVRLVRCPGMNQHRAAEPLRLRRCLGSRPRGTNTHSSCRHRPSDRGNRHPVERGREVLCRLSSRHRRDSPANSRTDVSSVGLRPGGHLGTWINLRGRSPLAPGSNRRASRSVTVPKSSHSHRFWPAMTASDVARRSRGWVTPGLTHELRTQALSPGISVPHCEAARVARCP